MPDRNVSSTLRKGLHSCLIALLACFGASAANAGTVNVEVVGEDGIAIGNGVRWILERDETYDIDPDNPATPITDSAVFQLHKSYMPVEQTGASLTSTFAINNVDENFHYYLSVLPSLADSDCGSGGGEDPANGCFILSGAPVRFDGATATVQVTVAPQPMAPAQASVFVFDDSGTINNAWDINETGLGDWVVFIYDADGGPLVTDVFGNPLGTVYDPFTHDVAQLGDGTIHTMNADEVNDPSKNPYGLKVGEALIRNIAPDKYGIRVVPPPQFPGESWHQTTTIEGTHGIDIWVRAGEPMFAVEFGPTFTHTFFGMVKEFDKIPDPDDPGTVEIETGHTISGTVNNLRMRRPADPLFDIGEEISNCWIGLNDLATSTGLYVAPCNRYGEGEGSFEIRNVPDGTYQVVVWDTYLLNIISFYTANVAGGDVVVNTPVPRWFGNHEHYVYNDLNGNGIRDIGEPGLPEQGINLRFRSGDIFFQSATDTEGYLPIEEVFPFFSFLIAEVDFARFKGTGMRVTVDEGGPIPVTGDPDDPLDPANGLRNPQIQANGSNQRIEVIGSCDGLGPDCESTGGVPPLLEAYNSFAGTNHKFEWGKTDWGPGENGGISGGVWYQVTRAENDPAFAAAEPWEPGVPRVPVFAYPASTDGVILDNNSSGFIELADVDHYPFGWRDGGPMGPEDIERSTVGGAGIWDLGDALDGAATDSWDDSIPDGCVNDTLAAENGGPYAALNGRCYDALRNWSQVRPGVFDGGYGIGAPWSETYLPAGTYVVEAVAPAGYEHQDELSKNVDFGDSFVPQALPPACVGDPDHTGGNEPWNVVPSGADLDLFSGVPVDERYTGNRPHCNFKKVIVADGKNTAVDFFLYTEVPISAHIQGNITNDIGNATNLNSVNFGEKLPGADLPISFRDANGNEVNMVYTDSEGRYNGLVPATDRINIPMPTGVSQNMLQACINPWDAPHHDPRYTQVCYTLNFAAGRTTYLDTPVLPNGAFVGSQPWQLDCNYPDGTPVIDSVDAASSPIISSTGASSIVVNSIGTAMVPDPTQPRPETVQRDFGFGDTEGEAWLTFGDGTRVQIATSAWSDASLTLTIPAGTITQSGQLEIIRADTGLSTVHGLTLTYMNPADAIVVAGGGTIDGAIQAAVDSAGPGDVVLVPPGVYREAVIMTKPIQLQGYGAGATVINASRTASFQNLIHWREDANQRVNCPASSADPAYPLGLLPGQPNNVTSVADPASCNGYLPGTGLLATEELAGVLVAPMPGVFGAEPARIDGLTITGADYAAGVLVNGYAHGLVVSNDVIINNQGLAAGGIRVGDANLVDGNGLLVDADNQNISIHHNYVSSNSSTTYSGGGIGLYNGSDDYRVTSNFVCGNFTQGHGGGLAHFGRSPGGEIRENKFVFNHAFDQTAQAQGGGGGGIAVLGHQPTLGGPIQVTAGSGPVKIVDNLIQGNLAGSDDGGGIMLRSVNGQDLLVAAPEYRDSVEILNNFIANNVSALAGAGIALQDAVNVAIVQNTIINNDSAAAAAGALDPTNPNITLNQPAGVVSHAHSAALLGLGVGGIGDFSDPQLDNNFVYGNRTMHWEAGTGLIVDGFDDLAVLGTAGTFNARWNILTSEDAGNGTYSADNQLISIGQASNLLVAPYFNGNSPNPAAHNQLTPLLAFAAQDEGGNFNNVTFGPLTLTGDQHLAVGSSAIDTGDIAGMLGFTDLFADIDGDPRPVYGATALEPDVGADEVAEAAVVPPLAPRIVSAPSLSVQTGVPYSYQLIVVDPNPGAGLVYDVDRCNGGYTNCNLNLETAAISASGLFTWTPGSQQRFYRVTVCDNGGGGGSQCDQQDFRLQPYTSNPPVANDDPQGNNNYYEDVVLGQFFVAAPGVLANDSTGQGNQPGETLTATLVSKAQLQADTGGDVVLGSNGAVYFTPADSWVGTTSFTYSISDGVNPAMPQANVNLRRRATISNATFTDNPGTVDDAWNISGLAGNYGGNTNGNWQVSVFLVPAPGALGDPVFIGVSATFPQTGSAWTVTATGISLQPGATLAVRVGNNNPGGALLLQGVIPSVLYGGAANNAGTTVFVQCPGDDDGDGIYSPAERALHPEIWCKHLTAGDGFIVMPEGTDTTDSPDGRKEIYTFGFSNADGILPSQAIAEGLLDANFPAPSLEFWQGQQAWLSLSNAGTILRPDLFDPHTVHFHGFPNASALFDGVPDSSVSVNAGFTLTYYYNIVDPGTYMYHCHVEAAEHMQMGMLGNLYVHPAQDGTIYDGFDTFVYNDGDGTTGYDVEMAIQIGSMDSNFHDEHLAVQPLPFADMHDDYPMLNGRGYPDTIATGALPAAASKTDAGVLSGTESSQKVNATVTVTQGERLLLRISNLNVTQFSTLATSGLPMQVVGQGAHILRGPAGALEVPNDLYYETNSVTLGGGEAVDVLVDTSSVAPGTYVLYSTNLNQLSNGAQDFGGMMTEIVVTAAP